MSHRLWELLLVCIASKVVKLSFSCFLTFGFSFLCPLGIDWGLQCPRKGHNVI